MPSRGTHYARLSILPLLLAGSAFAGVTLPTGSPTCGIYLGTGPPGNPQLSDCGGSFAATQLAAPSAPGITGVSFGTTSDITLTLAGDLNGGVNDYPPSTTPQSTLETLVMQTSGPVLGDNPGDQFIGTMPFNYSFSITPVSCESLVGVNEVACGPSDVSITWQLEFLLQGNGVNNSDGERGSVLSPNYFGGGNDIGSFSGTLSIPAPPLGCCVIGPSSMTVTQDPNVNTVSVSLFVMATLPENDSATFAVSVPQGQSFDFQSAQDESSVPEPATMGLLAAGLLLFGCRRLTSRS